MNNYTQWQEQDCQPQKKPMLEGDWVDPPLKVPESMSHLIVNGKVRKSVARSMFVDFNEGYDPGQLLEISNSSGIDLESKNTLKARAKKDKRYYGF